MVTQERLVRKTRKEQGVQFTKHGYSGRTSNGDYEGVRSPVYKAYLKFTQERLVRETRKE